MGSSQSQPSRAGSTSAPNAQPARTPLPTPAHRISTLRRLSTFGRSSSQNSIPKRDRTSSAGSSIDARVGQEQKKRRTEGDTDGDQVMESSSPGGMEIATTSIDITSPVGLTPSLPTSPGPPVNVTHPARFPIPSPTQLPLSVGPLSPHPQPIEPSVIVSPPLSPSFTPNDPLLSERLQTLSTIRQAFSQRSATSTSPRPSLNALPSSNSIRNRLSRTPTSESGRLSDRILSIFGPSTSDSAAQSSPLPAAAPQLPLPTPDSIEEVTRRMNQAQSELAETQRRIDEIQARLNTERNARTQTQLQLAQHQREVDSIRSRLQAEINAVSGATNAAAPAATGPAGPRRIPAGAVLVIQGLAQTLTAEPPAPQRNRQTASGAADDASVPSQRRRPGPSIGRRRRNSESNATPPSGSTSTQAGGSEEEENNSIESQARMISGLLTVAAAATATTLLAPASTQPEATRPNQANAISSFLDRFRSNRGRTAPTVESALGEYLRNMLNSHGRSDAPAPLPVAEGTEPDSTGTSQQISSDFQAFLETLQTELVEAVRAFAGPTAPATEDEEVVSGTGDGEPAQTPSIGADASSTAQEGASETQPPAIPTFHRQAGQISAESPTNRFGIIHGENGEPRRMNFFRAHMFPPVQSSSPTSMTGPDDPDGMVPCVFVGVRSIVHDPAMTTEDLVSHPNFPFLDGTAPSEDDEETETTSIPSTLSSNATLPPVQEDEPVARPGTPHPAPSPASRSLRQRILERLTRNRPARPTRPVNTYLVYVIGGYYPRSHPVLSIPNLITGGPLTDEEMQLIGEMMGPVKPPVATKDDIENSGLSVIDGSEVSLRAEKGEILDICLDRCLICLSDYEQGEQCRILKCRHAYHKDCVDQWLSTGRNSCPACRDEAVETKKAPVPDTAAIAGTSAPTTSASATRDPGEDMDMLD